jgi:hypothetical protein
MDRHKRAGWIGKIRRFGKNWQTKFLQRRTLVEKSHCESSLDAKYNRAIKKLAGIGRAVHRKIDVPFASK